MLKYVRKLFLVYKVYKVYKFYKVSFGKIAVLGEDSFFHVSTSFLYLNQYQCHSDPLLIWT